MANPQRYAVGYSFSGFQANNPNRPLPAPRLDDELANIEVSLNGAIDGLAQIRRSDGRLQNGIVRGEALSPELNTGVHPAVAWAAARAYVAGDVVVVDGVIVYRCVEDHTSSSVFATDIAKWVVILDFTAYADAAVAAAVQAALEVPGVRIYANRVAAVSALSGLAGSVNRVSWIAPNSRVYAVHRLAPSTSIPDMLGWFPDGEITPFHYGAVGDGATNDYAACQAALNTGLDVCFPKPTSFYLVETALVLTANGQRAYSNDNAEIRQTTTDANVITATSKTSVGVYGLTIHACGTFSSYSTGVGVLLVGCSSAIVQGNTIKGHRGGGVVLFNTSHSTVAFNTFLGSLVADMDLDTSALADIAVVRNSSGNRVIGNGCRSGHGTAVLVQAVSVGEAANVNVVEGNTIDGYKAYGIIAYRVDGSPPGKETLGTVIANNTVRNISGTLQSSVVPGTYPYGAGIYVQGAEGTSVTGNTVEFTHTGAVTHSDMLAPGGIGTANVTRFTITGNTINACGKMGIDIGDGNALGDTLGHGVVTGNIISRIGGVGIRTRARGRLIISSNGVDTTVGAGIRVLNSSAFADILISLNSTKNTGNNGIQVDYANNSSVLSNLINGSAVSGLAAVNCNNINVNDNNVSNHTLRGIQIASTCVGASLDGNSVVGTGTSTEGIRLDAKTTIGRNRVSGCVTNWVGSFAVLRGFSTGVITATATTVETDLASFTIPAGTFTLAGDAIRLAAFGTTRNSSDAKTLRVYVGAALVFSHSLTISQASPWSLDIEIVRRVSNEQRCKVTIVQGGTTKISDCQLANPNQTDTSAIIVRVTGQATVNNDIELYNFDSGFKSAA